MAAAAAATARFLRSPRAPTRLQFDLQLGQKTLWLVVVLGVRPFREGEEAAEPLFTINNPAPAELYDPFRFVIGKCFLKMADI